MMRTDCPTCGRATLILRRRTQDTDLKIFYCKTCDFACSDAETPSNLSERALGPAGILTDADAGPLVAIRLPKQRHADRDTSRAS
jgi:hypothetical protein